MKKRNLTITSNSLLSVAGPRYRTAIYVDRSPFASLRGIAAVKEG